MHDANFNHTYFYLLLLGLFASQPSISTCTEAGPFPRISEDSFKARLSFFDYDKSIPLEGRRLSCAPRKGFSCRATSSSPNLARNLVQLSCCSMAGQVPKKIGTRTTTSSLVA